jgi:SET domain-containing protein
MLFTSEKLINSKLNNAVTTQYSFVLRPSNIAGVGVFSTHKILSGTYLRLFAPDEKLQMLNKSHDFIEFLEWFGVEVQDRFSCPEDFGRMSVGWYLNHSSEPNAFYKDDYYYYALRDIAEGEEITIDYKCFEGLILDNNTIKSMFITADLDDRKAKS